MSSTEEDPIWTKAPVQPGLLLFVEGNPDLPVRPLCAGSALCKVWPSRRSRHSFSQAVMLVASSPLPTLSCSCKGSCVLLHANWRRASALGGMKRTIYACPMKGFILRSTKWFGFHPPTNRSRKNVSTADNAAPAAAPTGGEATSPIVVLAPAKVM